MFEKMENKKGEPAIGERSEENFEGDAVRYRPTRLIIECTPD